MRRAPQVFTRLGFASTARLSAQLSCEVQRTGGGVRAREYGGSRNLNNGDLALANRRWSSSEAVSNEPLETKASFSSPVVSTGSEESQPLPPPPPVSVPPLSRFNTTGEDGAPPSSSSPSTASKRSSNESSQKLEPWEIDARRRQNSLAPPTFDSSSLLAKGRSGGASSAADENAPRWLAGRPTVVPRTTAEAIAMNREALRRQEASRSAAQEMEGEENGLFQQESTPGGSPDAGFDARIETCRLHRQSSNIIKIWEEVEVAEKNGLRVKLSASNYQHVMNAMTAHRDTQVVAKCGRVYDHMKVNDITLRPETYGTYMKACSIAGMGRRAVALMEDLDRTSDKKFRPTRLFMGDLLMATSKEGLVEETKLFYGLTKAMNFSGNARVLTSVLYLFLEANQMTEALRLFEDAHQAGFKPKDGQSNKLVYHCILKGNPELVHEALDLIRETSNIIAANTVQNVLYMAARKKDAELATKMWVLAQGWNHQFSDMDYNFTVSAFMSSGKDQMAIATMVQAYKEGRKLSRKTLGLVAEKLATSNSRLDGAYYTLEGLHENGEPIATDAVNTIIAGSAIRLAVDRCFSTFDSLNRVFGVEPNVYSFNSMMRVLGGMRQQTEKDCAPLGAGMSVLDKMDRAGVKPDLETYERFVDLICSSEILEEELIDSVERRMANDYDLHMQHHMMGKIACAFHDRGMYELAKKWARKTPTREAYNGAGDRHVLDDSGRRGSNNRSFVKRSGGRDAAENGGGARGGRPLRRRDLGEGLQAEDDGTESTVVEGSVDDENNDGDDAGQEGGDELGSGK